jgi:threonine dehydrogenase-like Zn-dependent dehydrogenase
VIGAGPSGLNALAALAGGCSQIISVMCSSLLDLASNFGPIVPVNAAKSLTDVVMKRPRLGRGYCFRVQRQYESCCIRI